MDYNALAELLYPEVTETPEDMEKRFPPRNLPEGAKVTRFAPSPTGFLHLGNLYGTLTDERLAHQSGGVMFLRIEDTDSKREVEGGVELIIDLLERFGLSFDEGMTKDGSKGDYGPYRQSERKPIYHVYAKELVKKGLAYPCFCTREELDAFREEQTELKLTPGYYGKWAKWRDADLDSVKAELDAGHPYVLRLRSNGTENKSFKFTDLVKGVIDVSENFIDHIVLKSDGMPDYHFAHAVDDHLMRTTHVVRDESWLPSLPFHIELFRSLGFALPKYIHTAQVLKMEDGKKRKLSKRKDPEFAVGYFYKNGYPSSVTIEYLLTLLNSNFEDWRIANPTAHYTEFPFSIKKMSASGCLFDYNKLDDIGKNVLSRMTADEIYEGALSWAKEYSPEFGVLLERDPDYAKSILAIGRGGKKPRKDIASLSQLPDYMGFFYDEMFGECEAYPEKFDKDDIKAALTEFAATYSPEDDQNIWFEKVKAITEKLGFCADMKAYKNNPDVYKGNVADVSMFIRVAVTGRANSPDLYTVMNIIGGERTLARINKMIGDLA